MRVFMLNITLEASWVHSLKEKRMIVKSLVQKLKNKFNISVAEIDMQDVHKTIVIGIVGIGNDSSQIDSIIDKIEIFIEQNTDANIMDIKKEKLI